HEQARPTENRERSLGNTHKYSARQPTQIYAGAEMRPPPPDQARPTGGRDTKSAFQAHKKWKVGLKKVELSNILNSGLFYYIK
ncbi:MAG: hypothetical protein J6S24_00245, partial [Lentisphaeria bacterium]|nr:hypothetical protein [Lentisphaeria bacterium]